MKVVGEGDGGMGIRVEQTGVCGPHARGARLLWQAKAGVQAGYKER